MLELKIMIKQVFNLALIVFILLLVTSCFSNSGKRIITAKIKRDTTFVLEKRERQENIWGMSVRLKADFKDSIVVSLGQTYKHLLIGQIDTVFKGDWYGDDCRLKFEKIKSPIEEIFIEYDFFD